MGNTISGMAYIRHGAHSKCSMGTLEQFLNLPLDHGVTYSPSKEALMNANDHIPMQHIMPYGMCKATFGFCAPVTPLAWVNVNKKHCLDGAPALSEKSKLTCAWGGIITITPPKSGTASYGEEDEMEEDFLEEVGMAVDALSPMPVFGGVRKSVSFMAATFGLNDDASET